MADLKNVEPKWTKGKVHKVLKCNNYGQEVPNGHRVRACDREHNLDLVGQHGWYGTFATTDKPINCGNCLRSYWPDGRKRA